MGFLSNKILSQFFPQLEASEKIEAISTDSREALDSKVFVGIEGENFDGAQFAKDALKKGAVAAIVSKRAADSYDLHGLKGIIVVDDSLEWLRKLAHEYRRELNSQILVVGGSNGKTTTKEMLAHLFESIYGKEKVFKTKNSENSILGIALSLLRIRSEDYVILEVGIDEPGWMEKHLEILHPQFGLITTINEEHLSKLIDLETVTREELRLLNYLREKAGAFAANMDCEALRLEELPQNSITYGLDVKADIEGRFLEPDRLHVFGHELKIELPGKHNAQNMLAALSLLYLFDPYGFRESLHKLPELVEGFIGAAHRSKLHRLSNGILVFDDCYNANPSSMEKSLGSFCKLAEGLSKTVILGDMLDLANQSKKMHTRILNLCAVMDLNEILLFGPLFQEALQELKNPPQNIRHFSDFSELKSHIQNKIEGFQAFMLKGSRAMKLERLLDVFEI